MDHIEIKYSLQRRGKTMASVARDLGVNRRTVTNICNRRFTSRRIAKAVARAIGKPLYEVFPEYRMKPTRPRRKRGEAS